MMRSAKSLAAHRIAMTTAKATVDAIGVGLRPLNVSCWLRIPLPLIRAPHFTDLYEIPLDVFVPNRVVYSGLCTRCGRGMACCKYGDIYTTDECRAVASWSQRMACGWQGFCSGRLGLSRGLLRHLRLFWG